jgi:hypothetical protein
MSDRIGEETSAADLWRSFTSTPLRRSSGVSNIERTSMRDFLLRFEGSVYFGKAVAPKLK